MLSYKGSIRSETWEASRSKKKQKKHVLACTLLIFDFAFFSFRVMLQVLFQNGNKLESLTNVVAHVLGSEGVYTVGTMVSNPRITFHCSYSADPSAKLASLVHFAQRPGDDLFGKERPQPSPVSESQKSIWRGKDVLWTTRSAVQVV